MQCIDSRPCMFRTTFLKKNRKTLQCGILKGKEYELDGECPFCKNELSNIGTSSKNNGE